VVVSAPLTAQTTVQSTFGPGGSFSAGTSYALGWDAPGVNFNRQLATSFTYGGPTGFELFDIGLALRNATAGAAAPIYSIRFSRGTDFVSSTNVQSWAFATTIMSPDFEVRRFEFAPSTMLQTGETYWLHVSTFGDNVVGGWSQSDPVVMPASGQLLRRDTENNPEWSSWASPLPAYFVRAIGDPASVPEPAMATLLLLGLVPLAWRARRRQMA
jgi:hypothetical protein